MDENTRGGKEGSNNGGNIKKKNKNIIKNLQDRELSSKPHGAFVTATTPHRFQNMRFSHELDTHNSKHKSPPSHILPFLMGRTKIVQIAAAKNIVFVLAESGLCAAFSSETDERICFMNLHPDDLIKRLFYNKNNDSLITVSSRSRMPDEYRSTRIESIRRAEPDAGVHLFQSESFVVKFDDVNAMVLTYSAQDSKFKVFDLKNYTFLYSFSFSNVDRINSTSGIMLFIFQRRSDHIPVKIISIEDGKVLKQFNCLHWNRELDIIVSNEKLLVKHDNVNLQILDLPSFKIRATVSRTEFMNPSRFIFLCKKQLFLTLKDQTISVWNFRGELVTSLEDHLLRHPLWHPDFKNNNYITSDQNLIISYCWDDSEDQSMVTNAVSSINVSNILSGKCVAKINAAKALERIDSSQTISVEDALEGITTLYYDEERNAIYTGNRHGHVHVWSNSNKLMIKKGIGFFVSSLASL